MFSRKNEITLKHWFGVVGTFLSVVIIFFFITDVRPIGLLLNQSYTIPHDEYNFTVDYPSRWIVHTFGEQGFRNKQEVKLWIHGVGDGFDGIFISLREAESPSVDDVAEWGEELNLEVMEPITIELHEDTLNEINVIRHIFYRDNETSGQIYEDIYLARQDDMIIISLRTSNNRYEDFKDEFDMIASSFREK